MEPSILDTLIKMIVEWTPAILQIIGGFALIATRTPNKVDDKILQLLMDAINFLGGNLGKAKNVE